MMPRNQSTAITTASTTSAYGSPVAPAMMAYSTPRPGRIYCTIHFMMSYVLSDMSSGMISC